MDLETYLRADAEASADPMHPGRSAGFHDLYVDRIDRDYFAFVRRAVCPHTWLQASVRHALAGSDRRRDVLLRAQEHAEACVRVLAHELKDPDPFLPAPDGGDRFPLGDGLAPDGWLRIGLSALLLELALMKAGYKTGEPQFLQFRGPLQAMGEGFARERRFALAEAGRVANGKSDPRLKAAIAAFVAPGEIAWGAEFIDEAVTVLRDRVKSRKELLAHAASALREAAGIPHEPWTYLEPQIDRHAARFGIGTMKKLAVRALLKLA